MTDIVVRDIRADEATVNVTWEGRNGDLQGAVPAHAHPDQVRAWATEALRTGGVVGIPASPTASLADFMVDRYDPVPPEYPYVRFFCRPKTSFG